MLQRLSFDQGRTNTNRLLYRCLVVSQEQGDLQEELNRVMAEKESVLMKTTMEIQQAQKRLQEQEKALTQYVHSATVFVHR